MNFLSNLFSCYRGNGFSSQASLNSMDKALSETPFYEVLDRLASLRYQERKKFHVSKSIDHGSMRRHSSPVPAGLEIGVSYGRYQDELYPGDRGKVAPRMDKVSLFFEDGALVKKVRYDQVRSVQGESFLYQYSMDNVSGEAEYIETLFDFVADHAPERLGELRDIIEDVYGTPDVCESNKDVSKQKAVLDID